MADLKSSSPALSLELTKAPAFIKKTRSSKSPLMAARCSAVSPRSFLFRIRASIWLSVLASFLVALLAIAGKSSLLLDPESCFASLAVTSRRYWSCCRSVRGKWGLLPSVGFEVEVVACEIFGPACFLASKKKVIS